MIQSTTSQKWGSLNVFLFIVLPLIAGLFLSLLIPQPIIGVIYLNDAIQSSTAQDMIQEILYARQNPQIKAVVLVLNSPGGTVTDTESVYMELSRLRQTKPVVSVVEDMAASGAYYIAVGTDYIFAKPSSEVGNVGVIGELPPQPSVLGEIYSTGPYKLWSSPRDQFVRDMETLKQGFIKAVELGRGSALKIPEETILRGQIYTGNEALHYGLIDELGTQSQAFDKAASMAKISHYQLVDLRIKTGSSSSGQPAFFMQTSDGINTAYPQDPGLYMLYIPPTESKP
ncbi:MAG: S49 family peptidase [Anaerolineaceae bacterium]|nr:S49 family peptidase [Anaerolineaceae bacterium]